ncbi:MAG: amidohydrolase [Spirochaetales bacterium]|nr:amidohydrolase [Spirochaetales bacterium]
MRALRHGWIVTMDESLSEFRDGYIVIDKGRIVALGDERNIPSEYSNLPSEDLGGDLLFPSFINTHAHLGMVSFRSLADDCKDRLHRFLMPLENRAMTRELAVASTKIAISEMLLSGTTSVLDMYYFESDVALAAREMGIRIWAGETMLDASHPDSADFSGGFREMDRLMELKDEFITPVIAPHAPYSLSLEHLHSCLEYARRHGIMWSMHLSEMPFEFSSFCEKYGKTPIETLESEGLLSDELVAAHLLLLGENDIGILSKNGVRVSHCPGSNGKAAKGVCALPELLEAGCLGSLGTDGPASGNTLDMFTQLKLYAVLQKNRLHDRSSVPARTIVPLATSMAGRVLNAEIGILKPGYRADMMVLSLDSPNMLPCYDPYSVLVYSAQSQNVKDVYVDGRCLVRGGTLVDVDYSALVEEFDLASRDFERMARELL